MLGITWRRSAVRAGLRALATVPVRHGRPLEQLPGLADAEEILRRVTPHTGAWRAVVAYWPPQPERGRAYLHLLDDDGDAVSFLKLAGGYDAPALAREEAALESLDGGSIHFTTPRVRASGIVGPTRWLCTDPLPTFGRQTLQPHLPLPVQVVDDIRGQTRWVAPTELDSLTWWADLQQRLDGVPSAFVDDLMDAVAHGVEVGRAHGDFGAHNLAFAAGRLWVFDWEAFAPDAPVEQDVVGFSLHRGKASEAAAGNRDDKSYRRFVTCCAFGLAHDVTRFRTIVMGWNRPTS
ncbi:MAG TPA: hypothetical protein VHR35_09005 [Nocardioides sp.]|nr:hypothetical protein [Nocardioides sp.]